MIISREKSHGLKTAATRTRTGKTPWVFPAKRTETHRSRKSMATGCVRGDHDDVGFVVAALFRGRGFFVWFVPSCAGIGRRSRNIGIEESEGEVQREMPGSLPRLRSG
jgi:hypothetical protein